MTDQLELRLTRELGVRAADMPSDPALAGRVLARAGVVRRRRTVGATVTATVAVAAVVLVTTGTAGRLVNGPQPPPATRTSQTTSSVVPQSVPPTVGYAVNGGSDAQHLTRRTVVHVGTRSVTLPTGWLVARALPSGEGLLLKIETKGDDRSAYVGPDGVVTQLGTLALSPALMDRTGTVVLDSLAIEVDGRLTFTSVPSGRVIRTVGGIPRGALVPIGAVGPTSVLLDDNGVASVWSAPAGATSASRVGPLAGWSALWHVTDTDLSGLVVGTDGEQMRLVHTDGSPGWTSPAAAGATVQLGPVFAPDGSRVAAVVGGRLVLRPTATSGSVLTSAPLGLTGTYTGLSWEGPDDVLVETGGQHGFGRSQLLRCSASSLRCVPVDLASGYVVIAES